MYYRQVSLFAFLTAAWAAAAAAPKDSRIALRYGHGEVLILGGGIHADEVTWNALEAIHDKYPKLKQADGVMMGAVWMNEVPPKVPQSFESEPRTDWRIGGPWQLYPGAGPPVTLMVEKIVIISHPASGYYQDGAIAHFLSSA